MVVVVVVAFILGGVYDSVIFAFVFPSLHNVCLFQSFFFFTAFFLFTLVFRRFSERSTFFPTTFLAHYSSSIFFLLPFILVVFVLRSRWVFVLEENPTSSTIHMLFIVWREFIFILTNFDIQVSAIDSTKNTLATNQVWFGSGTFFFLPSHFILIRRAFFFSSRNFLPLLRLACNNPSTPLWHANEHRALHVDMYTVLTYGITSPAPSHYHRMKCERKKKDGIFFWIFFAAAFPETVIKILN